MNLEKNDDLMFLDNSLDTGYFDDMGECLLCEKDVKLKDFPDIIAKALSRKYCSNLNTFFYTKDINKILNKNR